MASEGITAADLLADPALSDILLHHVLGSTVLSTDLADGEVVTLNGLDVTVDISMSPMIDDAGVLTPDVPAYNGVVHIVDNILLPTYDDVTEVVSQSPDHTVLLAALQTAGLVATLQDLSADYTVFAPTDSAFTVFLTDAGITSADLLADPKLSDILLHHVLGTSVASSALTNGEVTTLNGLDVTVDVTSTPKIDNANVIAADIYADNGIVHVLDNILLPTYDDVTEVVSQSPDHTVLLAALQTAGLVATLQDLSADYTVFAPTDSAFTVFLADAGITSADLLADPKLSDILLHHVLGTSVASSALTNGEVTTLNGLDVTVDVTSTPKIDNANVIAADIYADNGIVHVLDNILLPTYDDVTEVVSQSPDHTVLLAALQTAGLVATLQDLSADYTVFAPTDSAFTVFLADAGITSADLLADPKLSDILLHHVLGTSVASSALTNGEVTTLNGLDVTVDVTSTPKIDNANVIAADIYADNGIVHVLDNILLPTYDDVTEVVSQSPDHTVLLAALQTAGLVATLQDLSADYTVFAPTDSAFTVFLADAGITSADLLADPKLSDILLHHVLGTSVASSALTNGEVTTLNGLDVTVDVTSTPKIDNANVIAADIYADNGIVHVLDNILLPTYDDVTEVVSQSPDHTVLLAALQTAGLVATLQDLSADYTVFAPTDSAFTVFLADAGITSTDLLADPNLSDILLHHVIGSTALSTDLMDGDYTTLSGNTVTVSTVGGVQVDNANVTVADIVADNGVVHVIDGVLIATTTTGIQEMAASSMSISPVPATNYITISGVDQGSVYHIYDVTGQIVLAGSIDGQVINVEGLTTGTYFIAVNDTVDKLVIR